MLAEQVNRYITAQAPEPLCDDCIAGELMLTSRQQAFHVTTALGTTSDFTRRLGTCSMCGDEKKVIRAHRT